MKRLRATQNSRERLNRRPNHVDFWLLCSQGRSRSLRVKSEHQRTRIASIKPFTHDARPQSACSTKLRNLFQQVIVGVKEKRDARREFINVQARIQSRVDIRNTVSKRKSNFLNGCRTRFSNVIAAD